MGGGGGGLPSTSEVSGSNLSLGTLCWNVSSYLPMPGGLQCRILTNKYVLVTPPINYPPQYEPGCWNMM